jgi:phage terminase large subunit
MRGAIYDLGLSHLFKFNKSDLRITYTPHDSEFIFAGLDDVEKLKSIQGITDVWIEEATEISQDDFDQIDLRLRGISDIHKQITMTFNPIDAMHWIKKRFFDQKDKDVIILKTTYKHNLFLDSKYIERIKRLKEVDPVKYSIYALGDWGVLGNIIFTNYEIIDFEDNFNRYYNGLDWGYNDPCAGLKMALKDNDLYIIDVFYQTEQTTEQLFSLADNLWNKTIDRVIADSSEPRTIKDWQKEGWKIRGAKKEKDSVRHGIGWIKQRKVYIHPRCQNFINEIQAYSYRKDKNGNILEEPVDFKNHLMDAMRYGIEPLRIERKMSFA